MKLPKVAARPVAALLAVFFLLPPLSAPAADPVKPAAQPEAKSKEIAAYTQDIIDAMDTDNNREVSKAEFLDFMSKEFDRLDVNHDGKLQKSEILNKPLMGQQKTSVSHR